MLTLVVGAFFFAGLAVFAAPFSQDNNSYIDPVVVTSPVPDLLQNERNYNITAHQHSYLTSAYDESSGSTWQYYVYWDKDGEGKITRRDSSSNEAWENPVNIHSALGGDALEDDSHNSIGVGVDPEGYIHVVGNHHNDELRMARSDNPWQITSFSNVSSMISADAATTEDRITYPNFFNTSDGDLMIMYADGPAGGDRDWYVNRWNHDSGSPGSWERQSRLFDGVAENFYPWKIGVDTTGDATDGRIHVFGTWRISAGAETNEDLMHLYSDDKGVTWYQYGSGTSLTLPLQFADGVRIIDTDQPPNSRYILNVGGLDVDWLGRPHAIVKMSPTAGSSAQEQFHVWYDGSAWQVTELSTPSSSRRGALVVTEDQEIFSITTEYDNPNWKYVLTNLTPGDPGYDSEAFDLASGFVLSGEPNYDDMALRLDNKLSLHLTRSISSTTLPENYVQDATIITLDLDQIDTFRSDPALSLYLESEYGETISTNTVLSGSGVQTMYTTPAAIAPDALNKVQYVSFSATGSVSDGSTTAELQIRYQSGSGATTIGKMEFSETTPTAKTGVRVPLYDIVSGNVEIVGEITSGTGTLTLNPISIEIEKTNLEPFPLVSDGDGLDNNAEEQSPNDGDVNDDGIDDRLQDNVGSIESVMLGDTLGIAVSDSDTSGDPSAISGSNCDVITSFENPSETTLAVSDADYYYPLGLFDYQIQCDSSGSTAYTTIILNGDYSDQTGDWVLRKFDTSSDTYSTVAGANYTVGSITLDGTDHTLVEIAVQDGGSLDDDGAADGVISDPVGFARLDNPDRATCLDAEQQLCDYLPGNSEWQIWKNTEPGGGGWYMDVSYGADDSIIAASDLGGYYRSTNLGHTWSHHGIESGYTQTHTRSIGHHPTDPNLVFIGSGSGGIFKSTDGGDSVTNVYSGGKICNIRVVEETVYATRASAYNQACKEVLKSTDSGDNWTVVNTLTDNDHLVEIRVNPKDPENVIFISDEGRFYDDGDVSGGIIDEMFETTDGGITIDLVPGTEEIFDADWSNDGLKLYFGTAESGNSGGLYSKPPGYNSTQTLVNSNFTGEVWIPAGTHNVIRLIDQRHYGPPNTRHGFKESLDGGASFATYAVWPDDMDYQWKEGSQFTSFKQINWGFSKSNPDLAAKRGGQTIMITDDGARSLRIINSERTGAGYQSTGSNNTVPVTVVQHPLDRDYAIASFLDLGCWLTYDGGDTWEYCDQDAFNGGWGDGNGGNFRAVVMDPDDVNRVWAGTGRLSNEGFIIKSNGKGAKGTWFDSGTGLGTGIDVISDLALDTSTPYGSRTLFAAAEGDIYRSTDDGDNWTEVYACGDCHRVEVDPQSGVVVAGGNTGFYVSNSDGDLGTWSGVTVSGYSGSSYTDLRSSSYRGVADITDDPNVSGVIWFAVNDDSAGGVWRYSGGSATLMEAEDEARTVEVALDGTIYYGSSNAYGSGAGTQDSRGIRYSTNNGSTWQQLDDPLEYPFVTDIVIPEGDQDTMWVVSPGVGVYKVYKYQNETDLSISITDSTTTVPEGTQDHVYTITVSNDGPADVNSFDITALPFAAGRADFSDFRIASGGGSITPASVISWTWTGTVTSGNSVTFEYEVDITGSGGQSIPLLTSVGDAANSSDNLYEITNSNNGIADTDTIIQASGNNTPTDIVVSPASINENVGTSQTVGTLSTTDADGGDVHSYSLVSGTGDADNDSFTIVGSSLRLDPDPDFETKSSYSVRIQTDDSNPSGTFAKSLTVSINDVNAAPSDITISNVSIGEGQPSGTEVGTISTTDDGEDGGYVYGFASGSGDADNGSFSISGDKLQTAAIFDESVKNSYSIRVTVNDGVNDFEKAFTVTITAPSAVTSCGTAPNGYNVIESDVATITGTAGNDYICAGPSDNTVNGLAGDDIIITQDGNDTVNGGDGDDTITGGSGDDILNGDLGDDVIDGKNGNDTITGHAGNDTLLGGNQDDVINGGNGEDTLFGHADNDFLRGGWGKDMIYGNKGNDTLWGEVGFDMLDGDIGDDVLMGHAGDDTIFGRDGNDRLFGGGGNDFLDGGLRDDLLKGDDGNDILRGDNGADSMYGGSGNDFMRGGVGNDRLYGNDGNDDIDGRENDDLIYGGRGDDLMRGHSGNDELYGDDGRDRIYGNGNDDFISGGNGNDSIHGGDGRDRAYGGADNDVVRGDSGNDSLWGDKGNDVLYGGPGSDVLNGGGQSGDSLIQ